MNLSEIEKFTNVNKKSENEYIVLLKNEYKKRDIIYMVKNKILLKYGFSNDLDKYILLRDGYLLINKKINKCQYRIPIVISKGFYDILNDSQLEEIVNKLEMMGLAYITFPLQSSDKSDENKLDLSDLKNLDFHYE